MLNLLKLQCKGEYYDDSIGQSTSLADQTQNETYLNQILNSPESHFILFDSHSCGKMSF